MLSGDAADLAFSSVKEQVFSSRKEERILLGLPELHRGVEISGSPNGGKSCSSFAVRGKPPVSFEPGKFLGRIIPRGSLGWVFLGGPSPTQDFCVLITVSYGTLSAYS